MLEKVAPATDRAGVPDGVEQRLKRLHDLAGQAGHLLAFSTALGSAVDNGGRHHRFSHFVHWPENLHESLRLAVLAGFGRHDLPATRALIAFTEQLAQQPGLGVGLNLSLFPLVNVLGLLGGAEERDLAGEHWGRSTAPEIEFLSRDARLRGYQGFVRVTTTADALPNVRVRTSASVPEHQTTLELFTPADFQPWAASFQTIAPGTAASGPLSIADDLPFAPFEVEFLLPYDWPQAQADLVLRDLLQRLIACYRALAAYGLHL